MRRAHQEDFAERVAVRWADVDYRAARISNRKQELGFYSETTEEASEGQLACGRDPIPRQDPTLYRSAEDDDRTYWTGVKTCGSVWCCPVCAPRILRRKGELLQEMIREHRAGGGEVYMLTATIPHQRGHTTHEVAEAVTESFRFLWRGGPADTWKERIGLVGKVRAIDGTFGPNGPHVHIHCLLFTETEISTELEARFLHWAKMRWERKVYSWREFDADGERVLDAFPLNRCLPKDHEPYFGRPHRLKALQLQKGEKAGHYVSELGLGREATRMDVKVGRTGAHLTPHQVLATYTAAKEAGDDELQRKMAGWWLSWCQAMHGKRHLTGVKRTAEAVDAQVELFEDDELAEAESEEEDKRVLQVSSGLWTHLRIHCGFDLDQELAELARRLSLEQLRALLDDVLGPSRRVGLDRDRRRLYSAPP